MRVGRVIAAAVMFVAAHSVFTMGDSAVPVQGLDVLRGGATDKEFAHAERPREFIFPRDHGPHPEFRHEWWYFTGNLDSPSGERFGFELTFFRIALTPPANAVPALPSGTLAGAASAAAAHGTGTRSGIGSGNGAEGLPGAASRPASGNEVSAWRTRQVYVAHFAITDVAHRLFRSEQKFSRDALGLAGAAAVPFHVWLDDWSLGGAPAWSLHAREPGYELILDAVSPGPAVLNGDQGLSVKSGEPGAASYYYSIPRVAVRGRLIRNGAAVPVSGLAWLDREWGSGSLGVTEVGWDWFALQLNDGSALMFYALRHQDGSRDQHSAGTWVDSSGTAHPLASGAVAIDVDAHWQSPRGGVYPASWRVRIASIGLDVVVRPVLEDQELATYPRYWEGAVDVSGTHAGANTSGRGYVELVGYAKDKDP